LNLNWNLNLNLERSKEKVNVKEKRRKPTCALGQLHRRRPICAPTAAGPYLLPRPCACCLGDPTDQPPRECHHCACQCHVGHLMPIRSGCRWASPRPNHYPAPGAPPRADLVKHRALGSPSHHGFTRVLRRVNTGTCTTDSKQTAS
jgi:hypothetical protein